MVLDKDLQTVIHRPFKHSKSSGKEQTYLLKQRDAGSYLTENMGTTFFIACKYSA